MSFFWWFSFRWSIVSEWNFFLFVFVLFYSILLYLASTSLFPQIINESIDFKKYYYLKQKWYFSLITLILIVDCLDTYIKVAYGAVAPDLVTYLITVTTMLTGSIIGIMTKNSSFHAFYSLYFCFILQLNIIVNYLQIVDP